MNQIIVPSWPTSQKKYELMMLQELLKDEKISRILEIGTWMGTTAILWAAMVSRHEGGRVYCCDLSFFYGTFAAYDGKTYDKLMYKDTGYEKYITELMGDTHDPAYITRVHKEVGPGTIDLMFIDGDHTYEGVKADFYNFSPLVKKGGYVAFHDILKTADHISKGCRVDQLWNEIKDKFEHWEFIDNNTYPCFQESIPAHCMGIGVIKIQ